ncbi:inositol-trisphosphate 3-kinase A-like isoform X2 [Narcine bancroftii]|uniref:inositol-trisphosphate 3-kinase A-like isoform X2 n=1 Tax=Narcine bancroftii TaxID=1343680 RepID=UPI003831010F
MDSLGSCERGPASQPGSASELEVFSCSPDEPPGTEEVGRRASDLRISSHNDSSLEESEDEVFSDEEHQRPRRRGVLRKTKSWKTFFTALQWTFQRSNSWVQLAGHEGHFQQSNRGLILKKFCATESACLEELMGDALRPHVPAYHGVVERDGESYIQMEDLLDGLNAPCIMDCKMGVRTYLEEELMKARQRLAIRKDLYQKMTKVDPSAPTADEHRQAGVTKPRYMQWRETLSSTATLGFRIEGITMGNRTVMKDFKKTKAREQIILTLARFSEGSIEVLVIGSSLLFVHERGRCVNVWMIDFGKTRMLPAGQTLRHDQAWQEGNREDGYLLGLENLLELLAETRAKQVSLVEPRAED